MIGVVGLGIMGSAMARHLLAAGFEVVGCDVDPTRTAALVEAGGVAAPSPAAVLDRAEVILTSLPSAAALLDVVTGRDGLSAAGRTEAVVVETSTLPLAVKEEARAHLDAVGVVLLDCPISGTGAQAASRDVVVYGSGDAGAFARARPVLEAFARGVHHLGPFGAGSRMKYLANHLVVIHTAAAAEMLQLAARAGMDLQQVWEVITEGAGSSRMLEVRGPLMVQRRFEPPTATARTLAKDLGIIHEFARSVAAATPLLDAAASFYEQAVEQGRGHQDAAVVFAVLGEERSGEAS